MKKVVIVTDSTADLPEGMAEKYGITVVPLRVIFGQEGFLDGIEISADEFFRRQVSGELSSTSQPTPLEFVDYYKPLIEAGHDIVSIHISSLMSGTIQSANLAKTMLKYPGLEVIDSGVVSIALTLVVLNAARAAQEGKSKEEILELVKKVQANTTTYFMVDTLEYLERGGRIGKAQAFLGTLLNVKPILTVQEGQIYPAEKARGRNKAISRMVSMFVEKFGKGRELQCSMVHGDFQEGLDLLKKGMEETFRCVNLYTGRMGPVVGTHGGPGLVGIACLPVDTGLPDYTK